jgi:hypothetical protein
MIADVSHDCRRDSRFTPSRTLSTFSLKEVAPSLSTSLDM